MTLMSATTQRARKPHECLLCFQLIEPGTKYHLTTMKGDDGFYSTHEHIACAALASMMCGQGPYRDNFPDRDDVDYYATEDVWTMLGEAQEEHVEMAMAPLDEAEQARGRRFVAAAVLWKAGKISATQAWAQAGEQQAPPAELERTGAECEAPA